MHVYKVVIVGAGVAGLAAAKFFTENGLQDFIILEAQDRIGGRIETKEFGGDSGELVELGAQWIHGEENDFFRWVKAGGFIHPKTSWEGQGEFRTPNGSIIPSEKVQKIIDWVNNELDNLENEPQINGVNGVESESSHSDSVGAHLKMKFESYLEENKDDLPEEIQTAIFQWANSYHRIDNCCNQMTDLSSRRWPDFEINGGELYNNFKHGAQEAIKTLFESFLDDSNLRLRTQVTKINWETEEIQVFTSENTFFLCQSVLVTCSIGVLKESLSMFSPPLPDRLQEAIKLTGFGPLTKVFLEWESPWWPTDGSFRGYQLLWQGEFLNCCDEEYKEGEKDDKERLAQSWHKAITGFDPVLDNPNVLLGWLGGPEAVYVEGLDEAVVGNKCAEILREFTGLEVPTPKAVVVSKWNSNPHVRGAYCYRSIEGDKLGEEIVNILRHPVCNLDDAGFQKPALMFAGEALSKSQYSTLHGAYDSGKQQAEVLLQLLQNWRGYNLNACLISV